MIAVAAIVNVPLLFEDSNMEMSRFDPISMAGDVRQQNKNSSGIKWVRRKLLKALLHKPLLWVYKTDINLEALINSLIYVLFLTGTPAVEEGG